MSLSVARGRSIIRRAMKLMKLPASERNRVIRLRCHRLMGSVFYFKPLFFNLSLSYQPDSITIFKAHPEIKELFGRFIKRNKLNNAGDISRFLSFILNVKQVVAEGVDGDFAELGVWRGNTASILAFIASENMRQVHLFDTYEGFSAVDITGIDANQPVHKFSDTSIALVRDVIGKESACCEFVKGHFPNSAREFDKGTRYAVVSLDCDLYEPMRAGLSFFYPLMSKGGLFIIHDYSSQFWAGAKLAVDEFCKETGEHIILLPDKSGSACLRKTLPGS